MNSSVSALAVPCEPSGLAVDVDCETSSAVLSWDGSEGAVKYFGCAQPQAGDPLYCDSTDSSCAIEGLECGGIYNFSVESSDGTCNSSLSAPLQAGAGEFQFDHCCVKSNAGLQEEFVVWLMCIISQKHGFYLKSHERDTVEKN